MATKKTSKEEIIKESVKLFKLKGYYNTSMADIAKACGLLKGSIYHHFENKDAIGVASLTYIHDFFVKEVYCIAYETHLPVTERMELFIQKIDDYFLHSEGGCLFGNLALELASEKLSFTQVIKEDFEAWEEALAFMLKEKYSDKEAMALAKEYVALTQGSIMMMNLHNNADQYLQVGQKIISLLKDKS